MNWKLLKKAAYFMIFIPCSVVGQKTYTSNQSGSWTDANIWNVAENGDLPDGSIPGTNDLDVVIIHHGVTYTLSADDTVAEVTIENTNSSSANMVVRGAFELTVSDDISIIGNDFTSHSELTVVSGASIFTMGIQVDNHNSNDDGTDGYKTQIEVNSASLFVDGDLIYERTASPNMTSDGFSEIVIGNSAAASVTITGELLLRRNADTRGKLEMVVRSSSLITLGSLTLETTPLAANDGDIGFDVESGQVIVQGQTTMLFNSLNGTDQKQLIEMNGGDFITKTFLMDVQNTSNGSKNSNFLNVKSGTFEVEDQVTVNQDLGASGNSENRINLTGGVFSIGVNGTTAGSYVTNYPSTGSERQIIDFNTLTSGTLEMAGSGAQSVPAVRNHYLGNLIINNTSGLELNLLDDLDVYGTITLNQGIINQNGQNLILQDGATGAVGTDASSYIAGSLTKIGTGTTVFPVGDAGYRGVIELNTLNDVSDQIEVQYTRGNAGSFDYGTTVDASTIEYWGIKVTEGGTSSIVNVKLNWDDGSTSGSNIPDDLGGSNDLFPSYVDAGTWTAMSSPSFDGDNTTIGYTSGNVSTDKLDDGSFVIATFGTSTTTSFLPVELSYFEILEKVDNLILKWATVSESNNNYFDIEKSIDGKNFYHWVKVEGSGTSSSLATYEVVDRNPFYGLTYYRLSQTDYDGSQEILETKVISRVEPLNTAITLFPNPIGSDAKVLQIQPNASLIGQPISIQVRDLTGKLLKNSEAFIKDHRPILLNLDGIELTQSMYLIQIETSDGHKVNKRMVVGN